MGLFVDAMSVHAATTATFVKTPAEESLLCHVQFLREMLGRKTLRILIWVDTRDMVSDGLTKGAVSREGLRAIMDGRVRIREQFPQMEQQIDSAARC